MYVCVRIHVSMNLASPAPLGFELAEAGERPRDNPSGLLPYKTYGKMQKLFFFLFRPQWLLISHTEHLLMSH